MPLKYHVVGGDNSYTRSEDRLCQSLGWEKALNLEECDVAIFTGGQDINPGLYNEAPHPTSHWTDARDRFEIEAYNRLGPDQWAIGICRGAQLIAVLNGGTLWQNVDSHRGGKHINFILDKDLSKLYGKETVYLNSIHHQMIRVVPEGFHTIVATTVAHKKEAEDIIVYEDHFDSEVVVSKSHKAICFQGHPEFGDDETTQFFVHVVAHVMGADSIKVGE